MILPQKNAFGMIMPDRKFTGQNYRFGFNGKENDNQVKGFGNQQDYGMRIYDDRLARFLSLDPLRQDYPELTPYEFASNTPIEAIDLNGLEAQRATDGSIVLGPVYMPRINQEIKRKNEAQNRKINSLSGNNLISSSVGLSVPAVKAGIVRFKYMVKSSNLKSIYEHGSFEQKVDASETRNAYVLETRKQTPEPFLSFSEDMKPGSSLKNNPYGRFYATNESVNIKMSVASGVGSALTMYALYNSYQNVGAANDKYSQILVEGGAWAGALYLGEHGAVAGARFGPWGAAIGGLGGSMLGGILGRKLSEDIVNSPNPKYVPMKWDNLPARPDNLTVRKYIPDPPFK